jgi:hypothetical protein
MSDSDARLVKALLSTLFSGVFVVAAFIDAFPWGLLIVAGVPLLVLAVMLVRHAWRQGGEYIAGLRESNAALVALHEELAKQERMKLDQLRKRCELQHLALFEGNFRYWLYGDYPPMPGFDVFEDWPTAPSGAAAGRPQSSSAPASPAAT